MKSVAIEVGGFIFHSEEEAQLANKELEGVKYIKSKLDLKNSAKALDVYRSLVERELFKTPVGISFLYEIRESLIRAPSIDSERILAIDITATLIESDINKNQDRVNHKEGQKAFINVGNKTTFTISLILVATVIAMLIITVSSGSPTILNYENRIINKYEQWDQELTEREQTLDKLEQEHNQSIEEDNEDGKY